MTTLHGSALDLARRAIVRRVAEALSPAGVPVMPLKGALLAAIVYDDPAERGGEDVDLLVPEDRFAEALGALASAGFAAHDPHPNPSERTLVLPAVGIEIDLHRALFAPGRFRLATRDVFARSREDVALFGARVRLPDPADAYAHAVGHDAAAHLPAGGPWTARDLDLLAARGRLDPSLVATRLAESGLARAARFTLGPLAGADPFARDVLAALPPDPLGRLLVGVARSLASGPLGAVAGHLTNDSLPAAARSAALAWRARRALR